jgi:hypothetical protein
MSLQIRRGTNAELQAMSPPPLAGEPIYVTDLNQLVVGDGTTTGGNIVGGNQALNTNSNVVFNSINITTTATVSTLIANAGTFNVSLNLNNQVITNSAGLTGNGSIPIAITNSSTQINVYNGYTAFNTPVRITGNVTATSVTFPDTTVQTTAWSGSVSTSTVTGLSKVGWSNNYNDLNNKPSVAASDQALFTTSSVIFSAVTATTINSSGTSTFYQVAVGDGVSAGQVYSTGNGLIIKATSSGSQPELWFASNELQFRQPNSVNLMRFSSAGTTFTNAVSIITATISNLTGTNIRLDGSFTITDVVSDNPGIFIATNNSGANPTTTSSNILGVFGFGGYDGTVYTTADKYPTVQFQGQAFENWARNANGTSTNVGSAWSIGSVIRNTLYGAYNTASMMTNLLLQPGNTSGANQAVANLYIGTANLSTGTFYSNAGNQFQSYPKTNVSFINAPVYLYGVSGSDTTDRDNNTLTASDTIFITTSRRSGVSGRRNALTATDQVFLLNMSGMNSYNSTGFGATTALMKVNTVENFGATTYGSRWTFQSVNSGTTTISNRLLMDDRVNAYGSDSHKFTDKSGGFTALNMTTGTATFTAIPVMPTYTIAGKPASGAVGQMICISNSTPGGRMAYWDTTNSRWSYVADDSAVV